MPQYVVIGGLLLRILFFDLETTPLTAHTWGLWQQNISLSQLIQSTEVICFGAKWHGEKRTHFASVHHHGRKKMLEDLHALMDEADVIVGWNSKAFDHKHINREFLENGLAPPSPTRDLDLMLACRAKFKFPSYKLDYVAQRLGVGGKVHHTGFQLWLDCMAGKDSAWKLMKKYQIQDVELLVDLYEKLKPWIDAHPNRGVYEDVTTCYVCGNDDLRPRGFSFTNAGKYQRFVCGKCSKWQRGKTIQGSTATTKA